MKRTIIITLTLGFLIFVSACTIFVSEERKAYCEKDEDCVALRVGNCCDYVSINKAYANTIKQEPQYCEMICQDVISKCQSNKCIYIKSPSP